MKLKKMMTIFVVAVLTMVLAACGAGSEGENGSQAAGEAEKISVEHELGTAEVTQNPQKVIVFDFGVLDSLDKLGVPVTGVPKANLPSYLSKYEDEQYENIGSLFEPDFEKISAIDPDVIFISGRQSDLYEELQKLGPTIYMGVDTSRYLESFKENMNILGEIFGKTSEVEEELAAIEEEIAQLREKASSSDGKALVILANDGSVSAYGPGSRFGLIHDEFGVVPVDPNIEASTHGMSISFEYIMEQNPDYLFVIDRGAVVGGETSARQMLENELVKKTKAYQNDHIIYLDPNYWYISGGGLASVAEMVNEVKSAFE